MSDLHTPAVSSTRFSELRPAIRDAIDDSIAKIVRIQDDEGSLTAERFEWIERQTLEVCMELGRRVLQGVLEDRDARLPGPARASFRLRAASTVATPIGDRTLYRNRSSFVRVFQSSAMTWRLRTGRRWSKGRGRQDPA